MGAVFNDDFEKKLAGTRATYKAILDTFNSARARKKEKLKERGGKQTKGEVGKSQNAEGGGKKVQVGSEGNASADVQVPPPHQLLPTQNDFQYITSDI